MKPNRWTWAFIAALVMGALLTTGCLQQSVASAAEEPEPVEEVKVEIVHQVPLVSATGRVVPAEWTILSFSQGGTLLELLVEEGDSVEAGEVVARMGTAELQTQRARAEANLAEAQARLDKASTGPSEEEIAAAEQALAAANARTAAAAARRDALYSNGNQGQVAQAESELFEAQLRHTRALEDLQWLQNYDPAECERNQSETTGEFEISEEIQRIYDELDADYDLPDIGSFMPAPQPVRVYCPLGAYKQVEDYYRLTELELKAAQLYLDELNDGPDPNQLRAENARIWAASAQAEAARARLDYLLAQPFPEQVAVAEAELEQAVKELDLIDLQLGQVELVAPFDGVVTERFVDQSEYITPGQSIIQIATLDRLRVATTDLSEIDAARIESGDPVAIAFDALANVETTGTVASIAPKANEGQGVTFTVLIDLDDIPEALRWGMTAFVEIEDTSQGGEG